MYKLFTPAEMLLAGFVVQILARSIKTLPLTPLNAPIKVNFVWAKTGLLLPSEWLARLPEFPTRMTI